MEIDKQCNPIAGEESEGGRREEGEEREEEEGGEERSDEGAGKEEGYENRKDKGHISEIELECERNSNDELSKAQDLKATSIEETEMSGKKTIITSNSSLSCSSASSPSSSSSSSNSHSSPSSDSPSVSPGSKKLCFRTAFPNEHGDDVVGNGAGTEGACSVLGEPCHDNESINGPESNNNTSDSGDNNSSCFSCSNNIRTNNVKGSEGETTAPANSITGKKRSSEAMEKSLWFSHGETRETEEELLGNTF